SSLRSKEHSSRDFKKFITIAMYLVAGLITVTFLVALHNPVTQGIVKSNYGDGWTFRLNVVQDVTLERGSTNFNYLKWLIVGLIRNYPKKRSLVQFESLNSSHCETNKVRWAKMYLYFQYSHKASSQSVSSSPYISRPLQVHLVKKEWKESQATSSVRVKGVNWALPWLDLNNDAESTPQYCPTTIYAGIVSGFVEFDVTRAVKSWVSGQPNYGLLVLAINENKYGRSVRFYSNAEADKNKHAFVNVMCDYSRDPRHGTARSRHGKVTARHGKVTARHGKVTARSRHGHGTVTARSRHGHGTVTARSRSVTARSRHGHGTVTARSRHGHGTVTARSRHGHGTVTARSRHGHGTVTARHGHGTVTARSRHGHGTVTARSRHRHVTARTDSFEILRISRSPHGPGGARHVRAFTVIRNLVECTNYKSQTNQEAPK
ncbi:hypothetical protein QZH41_016019, partial [Actinostola sp. cb2023]